MSNITAAQLKAIAGAGARSDLVAAVVRGWPAAVNKAKLTNKLRVAHFLAQIMTETGGLRILEESGAYSAKRILEIFGARHSARIGPDEARSIGALPVAQRGRVLFNRVYGVGNPKKMREFQNTGPNDGWLYRGGGMMQNTGKSNYAKLEKKTGLPLVAHPELLHQPDSAFMAAYLEWAQDGRCNAAADRDDVVLVRRIINGGSNGLAECRTFLAKAKKVLPDYAPMAVFEEPESEPTEEPDVIPSPAAIDEGVVGDPDLYSVQKRLKARHYSPGRIDGVWGGGTKGAIGSFVMDSGMDVHEPKSLEEFHDIKDELAAMLQLWESQEKFRPVSEARKTGDPAVVAEIAPEVVPAKRNFWASLWASIIAALTAAWDWISSSVGAAWDFFTDNKDSIPTDSGFLHTIFGYLASVPTAVWILGIAGIFAFIAFNSRNGMNKITESVKTGARQ